MEGCPEPIEVSYGGGDRRMDPGKIFSQSLFGIAIK
jgi:hypothetical protein